MNEINITSAQYIADSISGDDDTIKATINGTEMFVPLDPANRHYIALMEWASQDGNTIADAE